MQICSSCFDKCESWFTFRMLCLDSDRKLREVTQNVQVEEVVKFPCEDETFATIEIGDDYEKMDRSMKSVKNDLDIAIASGDELETIREFEVEIMEVDENEQVDYKMIDVVEKEDTTCPESKLNADEFKCISCEMEFESENCLNEHMQLHEENSV